MMLETIGIGAIGVVWGWLLAMRKSSVLSLAATGAVWYACRLFGDTGASIPFVVGACASLSTHLLWLDHLRRQATQQGD